ncbi:MAG: SRPBCC domain-containing protein [Acidimicrobiales bacterium]|jgi:uncharacterized protein YndB with AHSA1/START domain
MTDLTIARDVLIEAPADVVWRTITEPDQISRWFADRVELELRPGGTGTFTFERADHDSPHVAPLVVTAVEPPRQFAFRWGHPDGETPGPGNSVLVEFTLSPEGSGHTRLLVSETGLEGIGWPEAQKASYAEDHRNGWAFFTGRLEGLLAGSE